MRDKEFLTKYHVYFAWEAEEEEDDLNQASADGWQLTYGGCFHSRFRRDTAARYIYRLDYRAGIPDRAAYCQVFADQGWEYINSTFNGWHYFRKPYDPELPDSEYQIYTDRPSLAQMQNRWIRTSAVLGLFCLVIGVYNIILGWQVHSLPNAVVGAVDLLLTVVMALGAISAKRKLNGQKPLCNISANLFYACLLIFFVCMLAAIFFN